MNFPEALKSYPETDSIDGSKMFSILDMGKGKVWV